MILKLSLKFFSLLSLTVLSLCSCSSAKDRSSMPVDNVHGNVSAVVTPVTTNSPVMATIPSDNPNTNTPVTQATILNPPPTVAPTPTEPAIKDVPKSGCFKLDVKFLAQLPELPTGCEITSLTTVLNYMGYSVDKTTMADKYLDKGKIGSVNFYKAFVGDPTDSHSYGCYAPVIVNAANRYLKEQNSKKKAINLTGTAFKDLYKEIVNGNPVLVWNVSDMDKAPYYTTKWTVDGETIQWLRGEHCMVLIGFDLDKDTVTVSNPLSSIKTYDRNLFEKRYKQMLSQAVVIK